MAESVPNEAITDGPEVHWNHVNGPLLRWAGQMHWLTLRERISLALRRTTIDEIACRLWPQLDKARRALTPSTKDRWRE